MKLAIHNSQTGFHPRWVDYCIDNNIDYKIVNCYANNIIEQLKECNALMWHHHQMSPKDLVIAKQILFALEHTGFKVFPDFKTGWHFDDKVAQKYLFESINAPMVKSYAFYEKTTALAWVNKTSFPKVFKLRGGAGSSNVKLVKNKKQASNLINRAFGKGFSNYDAWGSLKERWRKFRLGKASLKEPIKGLIRLYKAPDFAQVLGREVGYVYFQDFIPNNDFDVRIIVVDNKAAGEKRFVRKNDFRASGSGKFSYEGINTDIVKIAFDISKRLKLQSAAFDFIYDEDSKPLIVEVSYGFGTSGISNAAGYWDKDLNWHEGKFNPQGWMVESLLKEIEASNLN